MKKTMTVLKKNVFLINLFSLQATHFFSDFIMSYEIVFNILKYLTMYEGSHDLFSFYHFHC